MELEDTHHLHLQARKRSRGDNGRQETKIRRKDISENNGEEAIASTIGSRILSLQHIPSSSRIYRVSRASGGKDRHSKVYTAKGLRDRRVRLSVPTAIQFYDLQDRLGYDQPSKAIEWLIKAAEAAINQLPSLDFMQPLGKEEHQMIVVPEANASYNLEQKHLLSTKSGCSSTSDTSKGSILSLSQSENRVTQEHSQEQKENDRYDGSQFHSVAPNLNSQNSFTELLTGNGGGNDIQKQISTADYFSQAGIFSQSQKSHNDQQLASGFSSYSPFGSCSSSSMAMMPFSIAAGDHSGLQQFSIMPDNVMPVSAVPQAYNLNFSIDSGLAGFNRGTLQSNSLSHLPHHHHHNHDQIQRLSSVDGANLPFFFGAAVASAAHTTGDQQFPAGFDGSLQLCYGDGFRHSDVRPKGQRKEMKPRNA